MTLIEKLEALLASGDTIRFEEAACRDMPKLAAQHRKLLENLRLLTAWTRKTGGVRHRIGAVNEMLQGCEAAIATAEEQVTT